MARVNEGRQGKEPLASTCVTELVAACEDGLRGYKIRARAVSWCAMQRVHGTMRLACALSGLMWACEL